MKKVSIIIIALLIISSQTCFSSAASKKVTGYFAPYGSVPELGIVVSWGIDLSLTVYYTSISSTSSRLDDAYVVVSMTPKATAAAGNGSATGTLKEKADGSSYSSRSLSSLPWQDIIHDPSTYIYESRKWHSLRVFNSSATIQVPVTYINTNAIYLFNNSGTVTATINR
ncbi:hypothetical protein [Sinanaerobacter chloroacetimidivorans]|jgi:hypothetical protein|uniref:DUF5626 domain-containing protein n=1 Tax=Sinanaerobacter chloroacetimidivorans TaxID=2818044 RepID=A0A8J8B173_9FIRM|nr:hypothetical protein [Sinanaerobacter chloroacetimidivorans]MBR0598403.1 hypothetical protein [Sinanaerobacter chloroacetimidivorans]